MDRPPKILWKNRCSRNVGTKNLEAVNQLQKTSDCIKIDPPGPGQNLKKSQKKSKKGSKILDLFKDFLGVLFF